jgi:ureidoacrylate peracid hydrolase
MEVPEMLVELKDIIKPDHTALIIVDMQKDFCREGFRCWESGRDIRPAQKIIPTIRLILDGARRKNVFVIHVIFWTLCNHLSDSGPWLAQRRRSTYSSELVGMEGTEGAEVIEELAPVPEEVIVRKHRYSGFTGTDLDLVLRSNGIRSVIITGVSTNACVETTLRDAFELEYYVVLVEDCVASWSEKLHEATLENVRHRFGHVCTSNDILEIWGAADLNY